MTSKEKRVASEGGARSALVAEAFVGLADTLVDDFDVVELMDRLAAECVNLLEVSAAGILLRNPDGVLEVVASSNEASRLMEVFQLESHAGPCVDAVATGEVVMIADTEELAQRWPEFAVAVERVGFRAVHAIPLRSRSQTIGALNLFVDRSGSMSPFDRRLAQALADIATIGLLQQRSRAAAETLAEQLQQALTTRIVVEQAKGVIAEYGGVDMGSAFEALRAFARERQLKLSAVARQIIERDLPPHLVIRAGPDH